MFISKDKLKEVRESAEPNKVFSHYIGQCDPKRSSQSDWWATSPFNRSETEPSFHMKSTGEWYCFSTSQGGHIIELVQKLENTNCYAAAKELIERGLANVQIETTEHIERVNPPIKIDLRKYLTYHHDIQARGISEKTCSELGIGYYEKSKRIMFQVRSETGKIITHIGRATNGETPKWLFYKNFSKSHELYNADTHQGKRTVLVEGAYDVAKLHEAGLHGMGTFGASLSDHQVEMIHKLGIREALVFFDRDGAGQVGGKRACQILEGNGIDAELFNWEMTFNNRQIPAKIKDVCDMTLQQIRFLESQGII